MPKLTRTEMLELAVDGRLEELRDSMFEGWALGYDSVEFAAGLMRAAYAKGMMDTLKDPDEVRRWARSLGYKV